MLLGRERGGSLGRDVWEFTLMDPHMVMGSG